MLKMRLFEKFLLSSFKRVFDIRGEVTPEMASAVPVVGINDALHYGYQQVCADATRTTSNGSTTVYTTPADKDFFLTGFVHSLKNASTVSGITDCTLTCVKGGVTYTLSGFDLLSAGAGFQERIGQDFSTPLLLDRNSTILLTVSSGNAGHTARAFIRGVIAEPL